MTESKQVKRKLAIRVADERDPNGWLTRSDSQLGGIKLPTREIHQAVGDMYPPILTLEEAAAIARMAPSTLKKKLSEGAFADCVKRNKPLLFWRDRFIKQVMKGDW